ncbi:MAG TPA: hypothetical protein VGI56_07915 [Galbitalea sp.]
MPELPTLDLTHVDYSALDEPITRAQVRAFRAQVKAAQRADPSIATGFSTVAGWVVAVGGAILGIAVLILFVGLLFTSGADRSSDLVTLMFLVVFLIIAVLVFRANFGANGGWAKWMRLTQFAQQNGMQYRARSAAPTYSGMIFGQGDSRAALDHLNSTGGRYFDLGSYEYSTGSGKSRRTYYWGFLALQLDRKLPNMVLDSRENNSFLGSDLPISFNRSQVLSLEGDFDKHFTLYCPKEYGQDALYVFTPDLMALLIDEAGSFDVEIVDDWMFVYSPHRFEPLPVPTYQRLFTIISTVRAKTVSQTERYHDDRVASPTANVVAPQGQRLRHGTSIGAIIVIVGFAAFWIWSFATQW